MGEGRPNPYSAPAGPTADIIDVLDRRTSHKFKRNSNVKHGLLNSVDVNTMFGSDSIAVGLGFGNSGTDFSGF